MTVDLSLVHEPLGALRLDAEDAARYRFTDQQLQFFSNCGCGA